MTQAIVTKYVASSPTKPPRMRATSEARSIYVSYDHGLDSEENHKRACKELLRVLGWHGTYVGGSTSLGTVWVLVDMNLAVTA